MAAISDNLIHFLARSDKDSPNRQFQIFKLILENGLRTGKVQIKYADGASVFNQILCFTDIPLRECNEHTAVYGKFGIGFRKSFVKNAGGNPARYFLDYLPGQTLKGLETRGALYYFLSDQYRFFFDLMQRNVQGKGAFALHDQNGALIADPLRVNQLLAAWLASFSFEKEMGDLGPARDETKEIDLYYKEREWRIVPSELTMKSELDVSYDDPAMGPYYFRFRREHVNMVVVPNEETRTTVLDYFASLKYHQDERLRAFGKSPLPVMNYDDLQSW